MSHFEGARGAQYSGAVGIVEAGDTPVTARTAGQRQLSHLPRGYAPGEAIPLRTVEAAAFRFPLTDPGHQALSSRQIVAMIAMARRARDRFLIALLACAGPRIGKALGLCREDLHLQVSSRVLGCGTAGPQPHVRRRSDNPNGALAKSRRSRIVPVTADEVISTEMQEWFDENCT